MLPSRPRLQGWNPDSLPPAGKTITTSGTAVGEAVTRIDSKLKTMADTKDWSGDAHTAATGMFARGKKQTDKFSEYTKAVGEAFSGSADPIGSAQRALLSKADEIDAGGKLHVSDQWVVLITGAKMTAEQAAALEKQAISEQLHVNRLLTAVGKADDEAAAKLMTAAQPYGFRR